MTTAKKFVSEARRILGLTQIDFAKVLGSSRRQIIRFEQGDIKLPAFMRLAIERLLLKLPAEQQPEVDALLNPPPRKGKKSESPGNSS